MDAQRFAYISDDTYTVEEVEECTQVGCAAGGGLAPLLAPEAGACACCLLVTPGS